MSRILRNILSPPSVLHSLKTQNSIIIKIILFLRLFDYASLSTKCYTESQRRLTVICQVEEKIIRRRLSSVSIQPCASTEWGKIWKTSVRYLKFGQNTNCNIKNNIKQGPTKPVLIGWKQSSSATTTEYSVCHYCILYASLHHMNSYLKNKVVGC